MTQADRIKKAVGDFGASAKAKLGDDGQPEDQLRNPIEQLFKALIIECDLPAGAVTLIGEQSLAELRTRPDFAVQVRGALPDLLYTNGRQMPLDITRTSVLGSPL